jgi:ribosome-binding protein aMBF1 (putative translation factor)
MNAFHHQDWTPVIVKKRQEKRDIPQVQLPPKSFRKLDDNPETFETKYFEKEYIQNVIRQRVERKWSQKDLAARLNVEFAVIQRLEQGKEVYNPKLKDKMNRLLGITGS